MTIAVRGRHLRRYRDIARLLMKYGRSDLVREAGLFDALDEADHTDDAGAPVPPEAEELADDLERMGPTFIKLGQLLSTRPDLIPPAWTRALTRLQDSCEPIPFAEVEEVVEAELGVRMSKAFDSFDSVPLASASLGQVHRAVLRDGRQVAVKVQRPGVRDRIRDDMEALSEIASVLDEHTEAGRRLGFADLLAQFRRSLLAEIDYRQEASNLQKLAEIVAPYDRIVVPQPVNDYTTTRLLTMDYVAGRKITTLGPLAQLEMDGAPLADQLFKAYLDQILDAGFFHADPHPGNVLLTDDHRVALIDLGMVARVTPSLQDHLLKLLLAVSEGRGEDAARAAVVMATPLDGFDEDRFTAEVGDLIARTWSQQLDDLDAGATVLEITAIAGACSLRLPPELAMLGKALLNLDQVANALDPSFRPAETLRGHTAQLLQARMRASSGSVLTTLMEAREFVEQLPGRVNSVMDSLAKGQFNFKVEAIDEAELLRGLQKLANRVTTGLVLAALIIGAALMMRVPSSSKLFGYPTIGIICFVAAAAFGFALVASIFWSDRSVRRRTKRR